VTVGGVAGPRLHQGGSEEHVPNLAIFARGKMRPQECRGTGNVGTGHGRSAVCCVAENGSGGGRDCGKDVDARSSNLGLRIICGKGSLFFVLVHGCNRHHIFIGSRIEIPSPPRITCSSNNQNILIVNFPKEFVRYAIVTARPQTHTYHLGSINFTTTDSCQYI